jgi:hypothetical protein
MEDYVPDFNKAFGKDFDILRVTDEYAKSFLGQHFTSVVPPDSKGVIKVNIESDPHAMARNQLLIDGYMIEYPKESGYFYLTGEGRYFISKGGYAGRAIEREKMSKLNEDQIKSVINTNKSVDETNTFQKSFGNKSLIIGALTMIFILTTTYQQCSDKSEQELQGIKIQLQKIDTTLKHIQPFPLEKDSSMKR